MEKEITIYDLELHQRLEINDRGTAITRVPGGWIYEMYSEWEPQSYSAVFVPYSEEYK